MTVNCGRIAAACPPRITTERRTSGSGSVIGQSAPRSSKRIRERSVGTFLLRMSRPTVEFKTEECSPASSSSKFMSLFYLFSFALLRGASRYRSDRLSPVTITFLKTVSISRDRSQQILSLRQKDRPSINREMQREMFQ